MALAAGVWASGQAIWSFYGLTRDHVYPFPSPADAAFLGYAVPAAIALFTFPRAQRSRVAFLRTLLDAAVIAGAVLFISWSTVLGPIYNTESPDILGRVTGLAYPIVDVVMASLVLVLTMRRPAGERLPWLCLGGGLLVLAVTDSTYVRLTFTGVTGVTGTPLALGWILAFLLVALAGLVPHKMGARTDKGVYSLALELIPYVPVLGAVVLSASDLADGRDPFLLLTGLTVLVLVIARQILIVFENVTLTNGLEAKVAQRTAELEGLGAIVNSSVDAIVGKTPEGVVTSWNPGAEQIYGYRAAEMIGQQVTVLVPEELREDEEAQMAAVREDGDIRSFETERVRKDGSRVPVSVTLSPIRGDNGIHGIGSIGQDITERRRTEKELVAAREAALESSRLKSEFLATMSHEIRTPMNGVVGLTAMLLETSLDELQQQYAQGVKGAAEALLTLINDILDFSKLEAGKVDLDSDSFDPRALVEEVAALLAEAAQVKRLELIAYCQPDVPAQLVGDAGRIRQVLLNLASNAVKFTETGEVSIRVSALEAEPGRSTVRFEVRDTGIGIAPDDHQRLFESFAQADASTTRRYGGTGLGLAISRRLTEAMGGQIGLTSTPGEGSTFWFTLPLPVAETVAAFVPDEHLLSGLRVLVVDDNATNRLVLESQLNGWRMRTEAVPDARTALARCREAAAAGQPYDVAVLDMCMPEMDGLELAREMSADNALQSIRVIMLTSTMQVERAKLRDAGVREWLTKPVRSSEFYDRLMRLMAPKAPAAVPPRHRMPAGPVTPSKGRVLIVEDNDVNQLVASSMVSRLGFEADVVTNGEQALTRTTEVSYSAVLMDCHMPVMDGFEATKAIRARAGQGASVPIIAMTAGAMKEDRERCLAAGMDAYLTKPVDIDELGKALNRWVPEAGQKAAAPVLDPERLAVLRDLGPADGKGLLPAAAQAFRQGIGPTLDALRQALENGDVESLKNTAHKLKGAAANIGAGRAAELCGQLEDLARSEKKGDPAPLVLLEAELAQVDRALEDALVVVA
jgi:two-component system sensor histidine kinase/response regulator